MELVKQKILTLGLVTLGILAWNGGLPQNDKGVAATTKFVCGVVDGKPTTIAKTKKGNVPLVVWNSEVFSDAGYNPDLRCVQVSARFQSLYRTGQLKYLTAGTLNKQPVICGTKQPNGACNSKNLLYTLKPTQDPQKTIERLTMLRNRATSMALEESAAIAHDKVNSRSIDMTWLEDDE
jgi:hypothetical protein